jgi:hypothetical protein
MKIILSSDFEVPEQGSCQGINFHRGDEVEVDPTIGRETFYRRSDNIGITKDKVYAVLLESKQEKKWLQSLRESGFKVVLPGEPKPEFEAKVDKVDPKQQTSYDLIIFLVGVAIIAIMVMFPTGAISMWLRIIRLFHK